jgi:hypothetical protein
VRALALHFAALDAAGQLARLFRGPLIDGLPLDSANDADKAEDALPEEDLNASSSKTPMSKQRGTKRSRSVKFVKRPFDVDRIVAEEGWILGIS